MTTRTFSGEIRRPLFAQIPLKLLSSAAERGRRRLLFVYAWLWFYAGRDDNAFPSVQRLALECGMKERDVRTALSILLEEGWIVRSGTGPRGTNVYKVRMEADGRRPRPKTTTPESKTAVIPPPGGLPYRGSTPPPVGESPQGGGVPSGGTPLQGDPINKPLNEEIEKLEGVLPNPITYISKRVDDSSPDTPLVTTAGAVVTDRENVLSSEQNNAPQQHAEASISGSCAPVAEQVALPDCARPHRQLLVEWCARRRQKHPGAPRGLSAADIQAIHHADALGVLVPFLQHAAANGGKSLATGYRRRCEQLRAGPAAAAAFEQLRSAYMAASRRVTCQSLPAAQRELSAVLADGHTVDQILGALAAEIRAQEQQFASNGFAPPLPDMARWLKERRFAAYIQHDSDSAASTFVAPIDPETGEPDPFALHRHITCS